MDKYVGI
jgi:Asp-tRNA(Asn)/Glu-tRNA(Gln) amidotransferase A subunit family amidase